MPNPTDTARALVEAVEAAVFNVNAASLRYPRSAHVVAMKAQLDTARAALLAHMAGVEHERDEAQAKVRGYEMMRKAKLSLSNTYGKDDPYATRPTEARDS